MDLIEESFRQLYPEREFGYNTELNYSGKFKAYNANVRLIQHQRLIFNFSKSWKEVSSEIQIGLIQELLVRLFKDRRRTINMELYNLFIKKLHIAVPKTHSEPVLEASYNRINEAYFGGMVEKPNLRWGNNSLTKLGRYEYATDTILISGIFRNSEQGLLDYIMHHEMLHKWLKFKTCNHRTIHHSTEFKERERRFAGYIDIEKKLKIFLLSHS